MVELGKKAGLSNSWSHTPSIVKYFLSLFSLSTLKCYSVIEFGVSLTVTYVTWVIMPLLIIHFIGSGSHTEKKNLNFWGMTSRLHVLTFQFCDFFFFSSFGDCVFTYSKFSYTWSYHHLETPNQLKLELKHSFPNSQISSFISVNIKIHFLQLPVVLLIAQMLYFFFLSLIMIFFFLI